MKAAYLDFVKSSLGDSNAVRVRPTGIAPHKKFFFKSLIVDDGRKGFLFAGCLLVSGVPVPLYGQHGS